MATPVYKVFLFKPHLQVYLQPKEQMDEKVAQAYAFREKVGGKLLIAANMVWSNEEFEVFGIEQFPSMDALMEYSDCLSSIGWYSWLHAKSYVGYAMDRQANLVDFTMPPEPAPGDTPLYKLFFVTDSQVGYEKQEEQNNAMQSVDNAARESGIVDIMTIYTRVTNEKWLGVGLQRYPNEQVLLETTLKMDKNNWFKYVIAETYIGKAIDGLLMQPT